MNGTTRFMNPPSASFPDVLPSSVEEYLDELALAERCAFRRPTPSRLVQRCWRLIGGVASGLLAVFSIRGAR
jgi:hypothetical protein